ncbi:MAG: hypothetical protein VX834_04710, partial [Myxococcota bacterium]|nr:hypothetical protein [Myxococcota bacterium]
MKFTYSLSAYAFTLAVALLPSACGSDSESESDGASDLVEVGTWCDAGLGGDAGARTFEADLSSAHVAQRLFGPGTDWLGADATLTTMLEGADPFSATLLDTYAQEFETVCAADATDGVTTGAIVTPKGSVAVIRPGIDAPSSLPDGTTAVVVDLRTMFFGADAAAAASIAMSMDVELGTRTQRRFLGFPSQEADNGWTHYESSLNTKTEVVRGRSSSEYPLYFLTGPQLSPEAATVVAGLRLAGRAGIIGYDVHTSVAESTWAGVGDRGLFYRSSTLSNDAGLWPDVVAADVRTTRPSDYFEKLDTVDYTLGTGGAATRSSMVDYNRALGEPDSALTQATMRAAMMVAYGTLDWFYPFFDLVGRGIDAELIDALNTIDGLNNEDRLGMMNALGKFMHEIHDGHGFYSDFGTDAFADSYIPIQIQQVDGVPMVRASADANINPGDTIVAIDGVPAEDFYAEAMSRYSASSQGYRFVLATDEVKYIYGSSKDLTLRDPEGNERTITTTGDWGAYDRVPWGGTFRESGMLDDLGAPDVLYVNLNGNVTTTDMPASNLLTAGNHAGVILDMRDYPNFSIYDYAGYFHDAYYTAPIFGHPTYVGPGSFEITEEIWGFEPQSTV